MSSPSFAVLRERRNYGGWDQHRGVLDCVGVLAQVLRYAASLDRRSELRSPSRFPVLFAPAAANLASGDIIEDIRVSQEERARVCHPSDITLPAAHPCALPLGADRVPNPAAAGPARAASAAQARYPVTDVVLPVSFRPCMSYHR